MAFCRSAQLWAAALLLSGAASAQVVLEESMTNWTVQTTTGWTFDVAAAGSKGPQVDRLDSVTAFSSSRTVTSLKRGHYVATVRIQKFKDGNNAEDLTLEVIAGGRLTSDTIAFSQTGTFDSATNTWSTVGKWVYMQTVAFSVQADNQPVLFRVYNNDTNTTKADYYFDWFKIGKVPEGKVMTYQSLDYNYAPWSGAWLGNATWFQSHVAEPTSAFGEVAIPAGVNWMQHKSFYGWNANQPKHDLVLQPGTYTINWRVEVPASGLVPFDMMYEVNGAGFVTRSWAVAEQKTGQWNITPNISFQVTQPNSTLRFQFRNIATGGKYGYKLDAFMIRRGAFDVTGTPCNSSLGPVNLSGNIPQLGEPFTIEVDNAPTAAAFLLGLQSVNVDLTAAGMTGCTLHTLPSLVIPAAAVSNVATMTIPMPTDPGLLGAAWYHQAYVLDLQANAFGGALSTVGQTFVGN
jgi:hypothetical protein